MPNDFHSGVVANYAEKSGFGYIVPDESDPDGERLFIQRKSLRSLGVPLTNGDRVIYKVESTLRGMMAVDVHYDQTDEYDSMQNSELVSGQITAVRHDKGFGFIASGEERNIFFHFSQLQNSDAPLTEGTQVSFYRKDTEKGPQAIRITLENNPDEGTNIPIVPPISQRDEIKRNLLAEAVVAKDNRKFDEAAKLYKQGLMDSASVSVQLVTSYAAMEKNRNRRLDAMHVYEQGLSIYPRNVKLLEDAGLLAASLGDSKSFQNALNFLQRGLELSEESDPGKTRILLLAIARVYAKRDGGRSDRIEALKYYDLAQTAYESSQHANSTFPKNDLFAMNLTRVRIQHQRGEIAYNFIINAGMKVLRANLLDQITVGADYIVEVKTPELLESYGISGNLLLRCMFKSDISRSDIDSIDEAIRTLGPSGLIDEQVVLLVVSSLPENVERMLYQRIEDRKRTVPAIVPITQSQIETASHATDCLRDIFNRWLFRRDLFAQNFPVSGRRFFGRERPLAEIRDAISNGTAAGVFGLRKVGKTSLLKEIERRANEGGDIAIYMDLLSIPADVTDARWIYWKLGSELYKRSVNRLELGRVRWRLGEKFIDFFDVPKDFLVASAFDSDLRQVLEAFKHSSLSPSPKVVVMFDEIERLLPNATGKEDFIGFFDLFSYLRGVAQESSDFVPIVTGANAAIAESAQFVGRDNPVFNFFREVYLPLLRPQESLEMIQTLGRGMGVRFSSEVSERIHTLTGGHPFFTRNFCSYVCNRHPVRPLTISMSIIENIINPYLEVAGRDFSEIIQRFSRDYPEELEVCLAVAKEGGTIQLSQLNSASQQPVSMQHLVGYQIVSLVDNTVTLTMELLCRWLNSKGSHFAP